MNYNPRLIKRNEKGTKSTYGRVLVISGSMNMSGCVYFAAMGAYRLGCGIVNIFTDISNVASLKILVPNERPSCGYDWTRSKNDTLCKISYL